MFEKIKNWFNPKIKPPQWAVSVHSTLDILDAQNKILRDRLFNLENQQSLILKQIDNDALVVANLTARIIELEADKKIDETIDDAVKVQLKVGDKVRVHEMSDLGEDFDGKTGRITSTKFSDTGSGYMLYTVRFPRKIRDSAIHEFYDDEIELVEE
jgi:hypothetical protein